MFSDITNIDWFDGPTLAIAKASDKEEWYLCSLVYIGFDTDERIFQAIKVQEAWSKKIIKDLNETTYKNIKARIKYKFLSNRSDLFIVKDRYLDSASIKLKKISNRHLKYYSSIEKVINQPKRLQNRWMNFFE